MILPKEYVLLTNIAVRKELVTSWNDVASHPIMGNGFWLSQANADFLSRLGLKPSEESEPSKEKNLQRFWGRVCQKYAMDPCLCPHGFHEGCNRAPATPCPPGAGPKPSCQSECTD